MDNITHTLTAIMMSRAGLNRFTPHATLLLAIGANAPDLDVVTALAGPGAYLECHRGASHSLVAIPFIALLVTGLVWLFGRYRLSTDRATRRQAEGGTGRQGDKETTGRPQTAMACPTDKETGRQGDGATGRQGDGATGRQGDGATGRRGDKETTGRPRTAMACPTDKETGRQGDGATGRRGDSLSWWSAYLVALVGVASNPIFDLANSYGVRLLWPFSSQWISADLVAVFDVWIWSLLLMGLVAPWLSRLVSSEIGAQASSGRGTAIFVLCLAGVYCAGRYMLHDRAVAVLDSRLYEGEVPVRVAAMPEPFNPLHWTGLVEGSRFMARYPGMNPLGNFDPAEGRVYYKPEPGPEIARARQMERFRSFLGWAQWPLWRTVPSAGKEGGVVVELSDLRFGEPWNSPMKVTTGGSGATP